MALADDPAILRRPVGFAVGINREEDLDLYVQRARLPGLLQFVRTFAGVLLEKEFRAPIAGYPSGAYVKASAVRVRLRRDPSSSTEATALLTALIDLMEFEMDHEGSYVDRDPDDLEEYHDGILALVQRLLDRFAAWAATTDYLPAVTKEAERGRLVFAEMRERLA